MAFSVTARPLWLSDTGVSKYRAHENQRKESREKTYCHWSAAARQQSDLRSCSWSGRGSWIHWFRHLKSRKPRHRMNWSVLIFSAADVSILTVGERGAIVSTTERYRTVSQTLAIERAFEIFGCLIEQKSGRLFYSVLAMEWGCSDRHRVMIRPKWCSFHFRNFRNMPTFLLTWNTTLFGDLLKSITVLNRNESRNESHGSIELVESYKMVVISSDFWKKCFSSYVLSQFSLSCDATSLGYGFDYGDHFAARKFCDFSLHLSRKALSKFMRGIARRYRYEIRKTALGNVGDIMSYPPAFERSFYLHSRQST